MAKAIRYALGRWDALARYCDDGHIAIDNNAAERALRCVAVGRKNYLFAGSETNPATWVARPASVRGYGAYADARTPPTLCDASVMITDERWEASVAHWRREKS
jgi:hypothetical protein